MTFVELTMVSRNEMNGEKILIRKDDIRRIAPVNWFKNEIPDVVAGEKPIRCSMIHMLSGQGISAQVVAETPVELRKLLEKPAIIEEKK